MDRKAELYKMVLELNHACDELKGKSGVRVDHYADRGGRTFQDILDELFWPGPDEATSAQWGAASLELALCTDQVRLETVYYYDKAMAIKQWLIDNRHMVAKGEEYTPNPFVAMQLNVHDVNPN